MVSWLIWLLQSFFPPFHKITQTQSSEAHHSYKKAGTLVFACGHTAAEEKQGGHLGITRQLAAFAELLGTKFNNNNKNLIF